MSRSLNDAVLVKDRYDHWSIRRVISITPDGEISAKWLKQVAASFMNETGHPITASPMLARCGLPCPERSALQ